jgi:hypothetical protein
MIEVTHRDWEDEPKPKNSLGSTKEETSYKVEAHYTILF